jgi:hypothetical protein
LLVGLKLLVSISPAIQAEENKSFVKTVTPWAEIHYNCPKLKIEVVSVNRISSLYDWLSVN